MTNNKKQTFNIVMIIIVIIIGFYIYFSSESREKQLSDKTNTRFAIGKIIDFEIGARVPPWFTYTFNTGNGTAEGRYNLYDSLRNASMTYQKSFIGKKFLVKFSLENPKYNEMYMNKSISDSLLNCNTCIWDKPPF